MRTSLKIRCSPRAAGLIALMAVAGFVAVPCPAGQPEKALAALDIRDIDRRTPQAGGRQPDKQVCSLDGQGARAERMLNQLWDDFGPLFGFTGWDNFGPDSAYRQIRLEHGGKVLMLRSWHPIYERDKSVVVTSQGVTALAGRSRAEVLQTDDRAYVARRAAFDAIIDLCLAMSPPPRR